MFPRGYANPVPPAGIRTNGGESVADCLRSDETYKGPTSQLLFRQRFLDEPARPLHPPGIPNLQFHPMTVFGIKSERRPNSVRDCVKIDPEFTTSPYGTHEYTLESQYQRNKAPLGKCPPDYLSDEVKNKGFGISTKTGGSVADAIHNSIMDEPEDKTKQLGYQTARNYNWKYDKNVHTFGIKGPSRIEQVGGILTQDQSELAVPLAVDRVNGSAVVRDPDIVDPLPNEVQRTFTARQVRRLADATELPPAGISTRSGLTIGETIRDMGAMDSGAQKPREPCPFYDMTHGIQTKPNPFPNPLYGPGKYIQLGLSDEDFLLLREKKELCPLLCAGLKLDQAESEQLVNKTFSKYGRKKASVAEIFDEFKNTKQTSENIYYQ